MTEPDRPRPRLHTCLRWLAAGGCGLVSAVGLFLLVAHNSEFLFTTVSGPEGFASYRYSVFGVTIAEGDSRQRADYHAEFSRHEEYFSWAPVLLALAIGLLVGGVVFILWKPLFMSRRC